MLHSRTRLAPVLAAAAALSGCASARFYLHFAPYYLAGGGPKAECAEGPGFRYCSHRAPRGVAEDPDAVLYFLHYAGGSERSWSKIPIARVYYAEFKRRGLPAPRVVTVSYGPYWMLFDKPGPKSPGRFGPFVEDAMPFIEGRLGRPRRRYVWGMSQGGLNGAELVLKRPDLWSGAVLSCPAIFTISVFAAPARIDEFIGRTGAVRSTAVWGMSLISDRVEGPEEWGREDPLARARTSSGLPPVYIDCTAADEFGFFEGARRLAGSLRERGQHVTFVEETGKHCQLDARAAAGFLADLAASGPAP